MTGRPERENEIRAREQEATPGPWIDYEQDCDMHVGGVPDGPHIALFGRASWPFTEADAKFTSHARVDVPYLLGELDVARLEISRLKTENEALENDKKYFATASEFVRTKKQVADWLKGQAVHYRKRQSALQAQTVEHLADKVLSEGIPASGRDGKDMNG